LNIKKIINKEVINGNNRIIEWYCKIFTFILKERYYEK